MDVEVFKQTSIRPRGSNPRAEPLARQTPANTPFLSMNLRHSHQIAES
jgi:hypothetical protein